MNDSCYSCNYEENYLIGRTHNFKIVLDETCQLFPGKYIIVSSKHLHPNDLIQNYDLYREVQNIKIIMEHVIRQAFGSGEKKSQRNQI